MRGHAAGVRACTAYTREYTDNVQRSTPVIKNRFLIGEWISDARSSIRTQDTRVAAHIRTPYGVYEHSCSRMRPYVDHAASHSLGKIHALPHPFHLPHRPSPCIVGACRSGLPSRMPPRRFGGWRLSFPKVNSGIYPSVWESVRGCSHFPQSRPADSPPSMRLAAVSEGRGSRALFPVRDGEGCDIHAPHNLNVKIVMIHSPLSCAITDMLAILKTPLVQPMLRFA
jgi:hypothetical protein